MRFEEAKKKTWFKETNRQVRKNFEFLSFQTINGYTCQLNFEDYDGIEYQIVESLSFKFEGFKNIRMDGAAKDYVGYKLVNVITANKKHTDLECMRFFLKKGNCEKQIEVWGAKKIFIITD